MSRRRSERLIVTRVAGAEGARRTPDELIVEEPMTIMLDDVVISTTMRTPGHDFELAVGFCVTEGLLAGQAVHEVRYCALGSAVDTEFNVVNVDTGHRAPPPTPRLGPVSSSCGWCGREMVDEMCRHVGPLEPTPPIPVDVLTGVPASLAGHQDLFDRTGAVHAAAVFAADGTIGRVREDVGRHNAVDKIVGAMHLAGELPATGRGLFISGRASVEMVHKAWVAGFGTVLAVSAPTALAVHTARRAGMVLAGFTRGDRINIYSPERPEVG